MPPQLLLHILLLKIFQFVSFLRRRRFAAPRHPALLMMVLMLAVPPSKKHGPKPCITYMRQRRKARGAYSDRIRYSMYLNSCVQSTCKSIFLQSGEHVIVFISQFINRPPYLQSEVLNQKTIHALTKLVSFSNTVSLQLPYFHSLPTHLQ